MTEEVDYYVVDSSSLIELNRRYPMDVFPGIWKKIEKLIASGLLVSPKEVLKEIERGDDELKEWAKKQVKFFKEMNAEQVKFAMTLIRKYPKIARSESLTAVADPFVIALAMEMEKNPQTTLVETINKRIVVAEESLVGTRIKIPFICQEYEIECIFLIEMFKKEKWQFE